MMQVRCSPELLQPPHKPLNAETPAPPFCIWQADQLGEERRSAGMNAGRSVRDTSEFRKIWNISTGGHQGRNLLLAIVKIRFGVRGNIPVIFVMGWSDARITVFRLISISDARSTWRYQSLSHWE